MAQREIEGIVEECRESIPAEVVALAREDELRVRRTGQRDDGRSGAIVSNRARGPTIWTYARHPRTPRRFTVAHEIAHQRRREDG